MNRVVNENVPRAPARLPPSFQQFLHFEAETDGVIASRIGELVAQHVSLLQTVVGRLAEGGGRTVPLMLMVGGPG